MSWNTAQFSSKRSDIISRLRSSNITPTHQRVLIGEALFEKAQHVSAEQVLAMVNKDNEEVSKATVYNTLGLFAQKGLINEVIIEPSKVFYDTNLVKHYHLYHTDSGKLEDIGSDQIKINQLPDIPQGTALEDVDIIIRLRKT
ncbi:MAG: Fur family transcriptional regulator [Pseudomonadota bacterium]